MRRFLALSLLLPLTVVACEGSEDGPRSDAQFSRSANAGPVSLVIDYRYSGTDWGAEGDDAGTWDDDEGYYVISEEITLGPVSECIKPWGERAETAACSWSGPSDAWDFSISIRNVDGVAMLDIDTYAGDADSSAGSSLPVASVPSAAPWHMSFSPDNAGGSYGSIEASIRKETGSADGGQACCVVCTVGQACGNSCIAADLSCSQPAGCACEG